MVNKLRNAPAKADIRRGMKFHFVELGAQIKTAKMSRNKATTSVVTGGSEKPAMIYVEMKIKE